MFGFLTSETVAVILDVKSVGLSTSAPCDVLDSDVPVSTTVVLFETEVELCELESFTSESLALEAAVVSDRLLVSGSLL